MSKSTGLSKVWREVLVGALPAQTLVFVPFCMFYVPACYLCVANAGVLQTCMNHKALWDLCGRNVFNKLQPLGGSEVQTENLSLAEHMASAKRASLSAPSAVVKGEPWQTDGQ